MTAARAFSEGLKRMLRAPGMVTAIWALNLAVALPLAAVVFDAIDGFSRDSHYHEVLLEGFDTGWYTEFSSAQSGVAGSFAPGKLGVGAWLANLDRWWDGRVFLEQPAVLASGLAFALLWLLLLGGVLEGMREGAPRPRLTTVLADGAARFPVFLRLALITGVGYYLVFRFARWLFPRIHEATGDLTVEREVLAANLAGAAVVLALLVSIRLVGDYAKMAVVVERRKSASLAALRGLRFVLSRPLRVLGVALLYAVLMTALFAVYSLLAPGAADSTGTAILLAAALGQAFVLVKVALRVAFLASELALFEVAS